MLHSWGVFITGTRKFPTVFNTLSEQESYCVLVCGNPVHYYSYEYTLIQLVSGVLVVGIPARLLHVFLLKILLNKLAGE